MFTTKRVLFLLTCLLFFSAWYIAISFFGLRGRFYGPSPLSIGDVQSVPFYLRISWSHLILPREMDTDHQRIWLYLYNPWQDEVRVVPFLLCTRLVCIVPRSTYKYNTTNTTRRLCALPGVNILTQY